MLRRLMLSTLVLGLSTHGLTAQDSPPADRIYVATYNIAYSDIPAWSEAHAAYSVPILEAMVGEGVLTGFNIRMHHTGGEYTIREGYLGHADTNFGAFWDDYLARYGSAHPAEFERVNRMIRAHEDEIWNLDVVNISQDAEGPRYLYEAKFQVNFSDLDRWNQLWEQHFLPIAQQAMDDGSVRGYVIQSHNTGGKYNWKFAWLFDEWDNFDEVEAAFFSAVPLDHEVFGMFWAHQDELWQSLPE